MRLYIDGAWFDLTKWASSHPGGETILKRFDGKDATDAFFALHSKAACARLVKMKNVQPAHIRDLPAPIGSEGTALDKAYRELRERLEKEGWFQRSFVAELRLLFTVLALAVVGSCLAWQYPLLSALLLGLSMQQAGWLGHDMTHSRNDSYCDLVGPWMSAILAGLDNLWWSEKHNTHHVLTNHVGADPDIENRPFLFLWAPPKALDNVIRPFQHVYCVFLYCFLYVSWRIQSLQTIWARRDMLALIRMSLGYIWLLCLPWHVSGLAILIGGFLVAIVVTLNHESEDMKTKFETSFVRNQFETTCDVVCPDPITNWLFGGMQYQLEHHLFPSLPRYKYHRLVPVLRSWAKEHGIEYRSGSLSTMLRQHFSTLKLVAQLSSTEASLDAMSEFTRDGLRQSSYIGTWKQPSQ